MIFEFYWSWYETKRSILMESPDKTQEEFIQDCKKAMTESFDGYMSNIDMEWASLADWVEVASKKMEDYGYKIISPVSFGYFGWYLPKEFDNDSDLHQDDELFEFKEQLKKMIKYNIEFENKI